jgi:dTDP-4-amino-4,6-dideoxygalactose transaminase
MEVPFLDLKAHHAPLREEFLRAIGEVIDKGAFAGGPYVAKFEQEYAAFCGAPHCVAVGNGTDALWLALLALGVKPGDEVVTVPGTFMATAEAISYCGARPVFVDIDERSYTMDATRLEQAITPRTKAIIPVQLFGQMADMDPILAIAQRHGIPVVEDACQAHGADYKGRKAGTLGAVGCFSFYPGKNLGAFGEGGACVCTSPELAQKMRTLRDHGQAKKYYHSMIGWNARMDGIQGAVLSIKLRNLAANNELRRRHAACYNEALAPLRGVVCPAEMPYGRHIYHIYPLRVQRRDELLAQLEQRGVHCGIHYPIPVHLQEAYAFLGLGAGSFPVAEKCAREFLSLPMYPELTPPLIEKVIAEVKACAGNG